MLNDTTATLLLSEKRYVGKANSPTLHNEYECPCGKGRIIDERVVGFGDYTARIDCKACESQYRILMGCGHIWELVKK